MFHISLFAVESVLDKFVSFRSNLKRDNADANRSSKEKLKQMELMTKAMIEEFKLNKEDERQAIQNVKEMLDKEMQTKTDMDAQALNALVQMAVQQQEMINDEER